MFKHILLPTDGSELSTRAVDLGIDLARACGAKVYTLHVVAPFHTLSYMTEFMAASEASYTEEAVRWAERYLEEVRAKAKAAGLAHDSNYLLDASPCAAILRVAQEQGCDLIVMGSHGWRGLTRLLLGSETQQVLLKSKLPVLVCR